MTDTNALSISRPGAQDRASPTIESVSGAQKIVDAFIANGVDRVFIYPGGTIAPILDVIEFKSKIEIICPRNEQGAGYAAIAHAKLTGKPAVFMVTSGPGVTNAVTPIADAYFDNVPLVVLTGQVGMSDMRGDLPVKQRGFQEVDTVALMAPITKAAFLAKDARELPDLMAHAFFLASTGRQGPVVIDLPMNVQRATPKAAEYLPVMTRSYFAPPVDTTQIFELAQMIGEAQRPVILAGGGALASGAEREIRKLADTCGIPVTMSLPGMGVYPSRDPLSLWLCGYAGGQYANLAIYNSDLLIGIGTTFHLRQTGSLPEKTAPNAKIVRIELDKNELQHSRVPLDLAINADAKEAVAALNVLLNVGQRSFGKTEVWLRQIADWKENHYLSAMTPAHRLKPQYVIAMIDRLTANEDVIFVTGVGQHQIWAARHCSFDYPRRQLLTSSGHGTMGFDLPAAIGAKLAQPDTKVVCIVGDGSLQMNIQELAAIAEMELDIKIIVLDNHALNIVAQFQRQNWHSDPSTGGKYNPDFAKIAKAYGIDAVTITRPSQVERKLGTALKRPGAVLVHCEIDAKEDLLPMLLGGHTLDDMTYKSSFE
ncbi:MAG: thiamine pyrophosphate-binding protein [Alphaproteobacteria bacterium]